VQLAVATNLLPLRCAFAMFSELGIEGALREKTLKVQCLSGRAKSPLVQAERSMPIAGRISNTRRSLERHKHPADLLTLRKLLFTIQIQRLQHWPITDGE